MTRLLEKLNAALKEESDAGICYLDYELAVDLYKRLLELESAEEDSKNNG